MKNKRNARDILKSISVWICSLIFLFAMFLFLYANVSIRTFTTMELDNQLFSPQVDNGQYYTKMNNQTYYFDEDIIKQYQGKGEYTVRYRKGMFVKKYTIVALEKLETEKNEEE